jgi:hypothetical protein
VIVLGIGDNNQGLLWFADAIGYWLLCFGLGIRMLLDGACFIFGISSIWLNRLRFYDFASFIDDFFHNLTNADVFLSSALTFTTIQLSIYTAGFYNMRLLGLEKEGLGTLVWLE